MTPDQANHVFMLEYAKGYREYQGKFDEYYVNFLKSYRGFDIASLKEHKNWKVIEELRRWCDLYGMKYDMFWGWACAVHLDMRFKFRWLPIFKCQSLLNVVFERCLSYRVAVTIQSSEEIFKAENYKGYQVQRDYYNYLLSEFKAKYSERQTVEIIKEMIGSGKIAVDFFL